MNILLINHYAGSPELGMEYRPYYMAKQWVLAGHKVTIVAADRSHLRLKNPKPQENLECQEIDGITYMWVKTPTYNRDLSGRGRNVASFLYKVNFNRSAIIEKAQPNVVIASSTYPFDIYPALKIAQAAKARLVWEVHDLWPLTQTSLYDYSRRSPVVLAIERAQRKALACADHVVSIIPRGDAYLEQYGLKPEKYTHIPNGVMPDQELKTPPEAAMRLVEASQEQKRFVVMYCGSLGHSNAMEEFILAAPLVKDFADFYLVGNGTFKIRLKKMVKEQQLENVFFIDAMPPEEVRALMRLADCLYLGAKESPLYEYGIGMNKLYDYMLAGKPILLALQCGADPVQQAGCGISLGGSSSQKIADGVREMSLLSPAERERMGRSGIDHVLRNHSYPQLAKQFLEVLGAGVNS